MIISTCGFPGCELMAESRFHYCCSPEHEEAVYGQQPECIQAEKGPPPATTCPITRAELERIREDGSVEIDARTYPELLLEAAQAYARAAEDAERGFEEEKREDRRRLYKRQENAQDALLALARESLHHHANR